MLEDCLLILFLCKAFVINSMPSWHCYTFWRLTRCDKSLSIIGLSLIRVQFACVGSSYGCNFWFCFVSVFEFGIYEKMSCWGWTDWAFCLWKKPLDIHSLSGACSIVSSYRFGLFVKKRLSFAFDWCVDINIKVCVHQRLNGGKIRILKGNLHLVETWTFIIDDDSWISFMPLI